MADQFHPEENRELKLCLELVVCLGDNDNNDDVKYDDDYSDYDYCLSMKDMIMIMRIVVFIKITMIMKKYDGDMEGVLK